MARDRLDSLRQVQRYLAARSVAYNLADNNSTLNKKALSPSIETVVEIDEENGEDKSNQQRLKLFLEQVEEIHGLLNILTKDIEALKLKQSEILDSPNSNDPKLRHELDSLMSQIDKQTKQIRLHLKEIEAEIILEDDKIGSASYRIKQTQHGTLLHIFMTSINDYLTTQATYQERCKDKMKRQLDIIGTRTSVLEEDEIEKLMDQEEWNVFTQGIISEPKVTKQMLAEIESRHNDIMKLEETIVELHKIFVEMSYLVESQGEKIDSIENHVNSAKVYADDAVVALKKAKEFQTKTRKKKFVLGSIIASVITVIIVIIILCVFA